jgi:hypothetical protein
MKNEINENKALSQTSVMVSAVLYGDIFTFIDGIKQTTSNKQTFDEALIILKKMIDAKV